MQQPVRTLKWNARRLLNRATAPLRALPDFLIIGAMKAGTTSLYRYLGEHPRVRRATLKEIHYFDKEYARGEGWYRAFFPVRSRLRAGGLLTGEATPSYLPCPPAPERTHRLVPDARLIALVRDPTTRAWSHYNHNARRGREPRSFEEVMEGELRAWETGGELRWRSYLKRGLYAEHLEAWERFFSRDRILVLKSEELFTAPEQPYAETLRFLGLPDHRPSRFTRHNFHGDAGEAPAGIAARLASFYAPFNERLYARLGRDLGWPRG